MDFLKIAGICLSALFIIVIFNQYKKEYSALISVVIGVSALIYCFYALSSPIKLLISFINRANINGKYFTVAIKSVVIAILSQFVSDTCRDFGSSSLASKVELAGKISIFLICLPLIEELFSVIIKLL